MSLIETRFAGALARAAHRWQQAFLTVSEPPSPQLTAIAVRRDTAPGAGRSMPTPFHLRGA
ncbi:hypothetical protein [Defluviimonas sp. SAOS-178_SWC]|uniref:hypothetical protein n=1 Tax=Defluviimonas sp. SAOS-178_SWC TaxID=3121287 RepID=UPI0032219967